MRIFIIILFLFGMGISNAQNQDLVTEQYKVRGNCGMCKERIENAANADKNVKAVWDVDSKILTVIYDTEKISADKILKAIANVGHDNEKYLSDESTYNNLPDCCLYDRESSWEDFVKEKTDDGLNHQAHNMDEMDMDNHINLGSMVENGNKAATALDKNSAGLSFNIDEKELLKAACCNLSESFETNATVDVSYSDALTGSKQISMLGLNQRYTLISKELLPNVRGLATPYGLNFLPGRWIQSIQLTKGGSSVVNGYESITGQINTELKKFNKKPETTLNFYGNTGSRIEGNLTHTSQLSNKWSQSILLHANGVLNRMDTNDDDFIDIPVGKQLNMSYILHYNDLENSGWGSHTGIQLLNDSRTAGEMDFVAKEHQNTTDKYGIGIDLNHLEIWNKTGYIFKDKPYQSIGWMNQFTYHNQDSYFGLNRYDGKQKTYYSNLIFESILGNTNHKYKTGLSFLWDNYDETYKNQSFRRDETVPGAFVEYTYTSIKLTAVIGARVDFHNLAGTQFTPRANLKYQLFPKTTLRASVGRGFRTPNVFAENQRYLASNRHFQILSSDGDIYGLDTEIAWNYGLSLSQEFKLFHRKSTLIADFFRTDFQNQVVVDTDSNTHAISFYNLDGKSFANSFQLQWDFQPIHRLEARLAYKYYDTQTEYSFGQDELPFTPKQRGFLNLAYNTLSSAKGKKWAFDTTLQWVGEQRLPDTSTNPTEFQLPENANAYFLLSAQVAMDWNKNFRIYVGGENLTSYTQDNPILDAENPFGNYFDGAMVYAPVFPEMVYAGFDLRF